MRVVTQRRPATDKDSPAALALGFFDGVHLGHCAVLGSMMAYAQEQGLRPAVFTFGGGPKDDGKGRRLMTVAEKEDRLRTMGVDSCYVPPFDSFYFLSPEEFFYDMLLKEYNARALFCGENFNFGARRSGNVDLLQKMCRENAVAMCVVPTTLYKGQPVSSTRIRTALAAGAISEANAMLGRPYEVAFATQGQRHGVKRGLCVQGLCCPAELQSPAPGAYIAQVLEDGCAVPAVLACGMPFADSGQPSCDVFVCAEEQLPEGQPLRVRLFEKLEEVQEPAPLQADALRRCAAQSRSYFATEGGPQ